MANTIEFSDRFGDKFVVHPDYVHYRHRTISAFCVDEIRTKGLKLLFNSHKLNVNAPTMCIHMKDKEAAEQAHAEILELWFNSSSTSTALKTPEKKSAMFSLDIETITAIVISIFTVAFLQSVMSPSRHYTSAYHEHNI